jgi:hypothetical protein
MACSGSGVNDRFFGEVGDPVPVSPCADGQPKDGAGIPLGMGGMSAAHENELYGVTRGGSSEVVRLGNSENRPPCRMDHDCLAAVIRCPSRPHPGTCREISSTCARATARQWLYGFNPSSLRGASSRYLSSKYAT